MLEMTYEDADGIKNQFGHQMVTVWSPSCFYREAETKKPTASGWF